MDQAVRCATIRKPFDMGDPVVYNEHSKFVLQCANDLLRSQRIPFKIDEFNKRVLRFLLYYFNDSQLAEQMEFNGRQMRLGHPILLNGGVGVGKTLLMEVFELYLRRTNNPNTFHSTSVTEMLDYYKVNDHLDAYTYNLGRSSIEGKPIALCVNDVGLKTQRYFGNDMQDIVDEFFHARNEIWTQYGLCCHITTNLTPAEMKEVFEDEYGRLNDRWKIYNVIHLDGESRREATPKVE